MTAICLHMFFFVCVNCAGLGTRLVLETAVCNLSNLTQAYNYLYPDLLNWLHSLSFNFRSPLLSTLCRWLVWRFETLCEMSCGTLPKHHRTNQMYPMPQRALSERHWTGDMYPMPQRALSERHWTGDMSMLQKRRTSRQTWTNRMQKVSTRLLFRVSWDIFFAPSIITMLGVMIMEDPLNAKVVCYTCLLIWLLASNFYYII